MILIRLTGLGKQHTQSVHRLRNFIIEEVSKCQICNKQSCQECSIDCIIDMTSASTRLIAEVLQPCVVHGSTAAFNREQLRDAIQYAIQRVTGDDSDTPVLYLIKASCQILEGTE